MLIAKHTRALVAYVVVFGSPLTHLCLQECESIVSECDSSALHCEIVLSALGDRVASQWCLLLLEVATS